MLKGQYLFGVAIILYWALRLHINGLGVVYIMELYAVHMHV